MYEQKDVPSEEQYLRPPRVRLRSLLFTQVGLQLPTGTPPSSVITLRYALLEQEVQASGSFSATQLLQAQ